MNVTISNCNKSAKGTTTISIQLCESNYTYTHALSISVTHTRAICNVSHITDVISNNGYEIRKLSY